MSQSHYDPRVRHHRRGLLRRHRRLPDLLTHRGVIADEDCKLLGCGRLGGLLYLQGGASCGAGPELEPARRTVPVAPGTERGTGRSG